MEKEKILSTLIEKLGKTSLSQRTIEVYVDKHLPAEGIDPDEAYWSAAVDTLKALDGQYNHDIADYKRSNPNEPPKVDKPDVQPEPKEPKQDVPEDLVAKWSSQIEALQKRIDERDKRDNEAELLRKVESGMKAKGADNAFVLKSTLHDAEIDPSKSVETLVDDLLAKYDANIAEAFGDGAQPRTSGGGGGTKGSTAADKFFADKRSREGWNEK